MVSTFGDRLSLRRHHVNEVLRWLLHGRWEEFQQLLVQRDPLLHPSVNTQGQVSEVSLYSCI